MSSPPPDPYPPDTPAQALWYPIHGIVLTVVWCLVADALLLIVRYYKNWQKHLLMHSLFTVVNILTVIVVGGVVIADRSYLFNWPGFSTMALATQIHFIFGLLFTATVVGVQILGLIMKGQVENVAEPPEKTASKKRVHKITGYTFYFLSKLQLLLGWYVDGPGGWTPMMTVLMIYYALFFSLRFVYFDRLFLNKNENLYQSCFTAKPEALLPVFESIAEMIENGVSKRSILQNYPEAKYVMYKSRMYDVSGLLHPGGMFIIDNLIGEQISRYIHGAYGLQISRIGSHDHSIYAKRFLNELYMLDLDFSKLNLIKPLIGEKINLPTNWKLKKSSVLSKGMNVFQFVSDRYRLHTSPKILYLGRHFILTPISGSLPPRLYTLALSMSSLHQRHIQNIRQALQSGQTDRKIEELPDEMAQLPFVIKQYKIKGLSEYIHSLPQNGQVRIEGPFGRGLELEKGNFYAFCGGTGVLPLLDLVYEIFLEVYRQVSRSPRQSRLPEQFHFTLYLSVNTAEDLFGLDIIPLTYRLCTKHNIKLFQLFVRVSKGQHPQDIPVLQSRLDQAQLIRIVNDQDIQMALVCGSPEMNYNVGNSLIKLLGKDKVHIL